MQQYLDLLRRLTTEGIRKENRTGTDTIAVFGHQMRFDLSKSFPLVTTKKVHVKSVLYELFWMLNGDTNVKFLQDHGVTIWDEWAKANYRPELGWPEGELGPVYGGQWRSWGANERGGAGVDQISEIVNKLRNNPSDRRIILSSWNVADIPRMKLPPCHLFAQFDVTTRPCEEYPRLSCHMYIRSWDVFLGGPFNIAQYAFLTHILAHDAGFGVGDLIISSGDTHLYVNHLEQVQEQLSREPRRRPRLTIVQRGQSAHAREHGKEESRLAGYQYDDFQIHDYDPHPAIRAEVAV
jgi:thymidylate synthase